MANCSRTSEEVEISYVMAKVLADDGTNPVDIVKQVADQLASEGVQNIEEALYESPSIEAIMISDTNALVEIATHIEAIKTRQTNGEIGVVESMMKTTAIATTASITHDFTNEQKDSLSTNTESESENMFTKDYSEERLFALPLPAEYGDDNLQLQNFIDLYFNQKESYFKDFNNVISMSFRNILMNNILGSQLSTVADLNIASSDIHSRFMHLYSQWEEDAAVIGKYTMAQIDSAFMQDTKEAAIIRNKYYNYLIYTNLDIVLRHIAKGVSISRIIHNKKDYKFYKGVSVSTANGLAEDYTIAKDAHIYDMVMDVVEGAPVEFLENLRKASTDLINDDGTTTIVNKYFVISGLEDGYTSLSNIANNLGLKIKGENTSMDRIYTGDVFLLSDDGLSITRVSPPIQLTFTQNTQFKHGHEEVFDGFKNDSPFIQFLVQSTTRLMYQEGSPHFVQDTSNHSLTVTEFLNVSMELSKLKDRKREGIASFLKAHLELNKKDNSSRTILFRSIYYNYFADEKFSYLPSNSTKEVYAVSVRHLAASKLPSADNTGLNENLQDRIMSGIVSYFSKKSSPRVLYTDERITTLLSADNNPLEVILPEALENVEYYTYEKRTGVRIDADHVFNDTTQKLNITINYAYEKSATISIGVNSKKEVNVSIDTNNFNDLMQNNGSDLIKLFKHLGLTGNFIDYRFISRLTSNESSTRIFISGLAAYIIMAKSGYGENVLNEKYSTDIQKLLASHYVDSKVSTILKVPIGAVSEAYSMVFGSLASTSEINGEGNSTTKVTNIDRMERLKHYLEDSANKYSKFGITTYFNNDYDLLNYSVFRPQGQLELSPEQKLASKIYSKIGKSHIKDGIKKHMNFFSNEDMTAYQRFQHLFEGLFISELYNTRNFAQQTFLTQPMTFSDRTKIHVYPVTLATTLTQDGLLEDLQDNYINLFRGKYGSMQKLVSENWAKYLLSDELEKALNKLGEYSQEEIYNIVENAKNIGIELININSNRFFTENTLSSIAKKIANLKIPTRALFESKLLVRKLHYVNIDGNYVMPETTGGLMVEYLKSKNRAHEFVQYNINKSRETLNIDKINYKGFSDPKIEARAAKLLGLTTLDDVFGKMFEIYHLLTTPANESILDTTMSFETEFGENKLAKELTLSDKPFRFTDILPMLAERTEQFKKQSKRVQPLNSVGIQPEIKRSYGEFKKALPYNDLLGHAQSVYDNISASSHPMHKAMADGVFTKLNGSYTDINGNMMITVGSVIFPINIAEFYNVFELATNSMSDKDMDIYTTYKSEIDEAIDKINSSIVKGKFIVKMPGTFNNYSLFNSKDNLKLIIDKLNNDEGEIGMGLDNTSNQFLLDEDMTRGFMNILGALGKKKFLSQDSFDGIQFGHPLYAIMLSGSMGNQFSSFSTEGSSTKDLTQYRDLTTGELIIQKKSTGFVFSNEILEEGGNEIMHNIFKILNTKITFPHGISFQYTDKNGMLKAKFVKSFLDAEEFIRVLIETDINIPIAEKEAALIDKLNNIFGDYAKITSKFNNTEINGIILQVKDYTTGKMVWEQFDTLQDLWEFNGSYFNDTSWVQVANTLAANPVVRNSYIQKFGFTSAQKTGSKGMMDDRLLKDHRMTAEETVYNEIPNDNHIVMLQKLHATDTSDAAEHRSTLAITSQFVSSLIFEGRTPIAALNATLGQAAINSNRIKRVFLSIHEQILDNPELLEMDTQQVLSSGKAFSQLEAEDITNDIVEEYNRILAKADMKFKRLLFTSKTLDWLTKSIHGDRNSPTVIKAITAAKPGDPLNADLLRIPAVNKIRSTMDKDIARIRVSGFIGVVGTLDFITSTIDTPVGRMSRGQAIKYALEEGDGKNLIKLKAAEFFGQDRVLPTDYVRVFRKGKVKPRLEQAGNINMNLGDITHIEHVVPYSDKGANRRITGETLAIESNEVRAALKNQFNTEFNGLVENLISEYAQSNEFIYLNPDLEVYKNKIISSFHSTEDIDITAMYVLEYENFLAAYEQSNMSLYKPVEDFVEFMYKQGNNLLLPGDNVYAPYVIDRDLYNNVTGEYTIDPYFEDMFIEWAIDNETEVENDKKINNVIHRKYQRDTADTPLIIAKKNGKPTDVVPAFYAYMLDDNDELDIENLNVEHLDDLEVYTDTLEDLNWAKTKFKLEDGTELSIAHSLAYQKLYTFNRNPKLFDKVFNNGEYDNLSNTTIGEKLLAELKIFTEQEDVVIEPSEVYISNFNYSAYGVPQNTKLQTMVGYSTNKTDRINFANNYFNKLLLKNHKFKAPKFNILDKSSSAEYTNMLMFFMRLSVKNSLPKSLRYAINEHVNYIKHYKYSFDMASFAEKERIHDLITKHLINKIVTARTEHAKEMAKSLVDSLYIMPPRIPGQSKGAGYLSVVVGFINSTKNAIYSAREAYVVTGKDNDIDTDNILTSYVDEDGIKYDYSKYLLSPDGKNSAGINGSAGVSPIMDNKGSNFIMEAEVRQLASNIDDLYEDMYDFLKEPIDEKAKRKHKNKEINKLLKRHDKVKINYIIDAMRYVMSHKANAVEMETPITMESLQSIADEAMNRIDKDLYNYELHGINSYNNIWIPNLETANMSGKSAIAPFANGQRVYSAVLNIQYNRSEILMIGSMSKESYSLSDIQYNKDHLAHVDENGELPEGVGLSITVPRKNANGDEVSRLIIRDTFAHLEHKKVQEAIKTINDPNASSLGKNQAWELLSQLISASTDNAKELLLDKIGANNDTNSIISNMITLGFEFEDIYKFLTQGSLKGVFKALKDARDSGDKKSLHSIIDKALKGKLEGIYSKSSNSTVVNLALTELKGILAASDALNDFRRVLTLAQDSKIETRDLYTVLKPIYTANTTVTDLLDDSKGLGENEFIPGEMPINPLFYLKNHIHARYLLKYVDLTEMMVSAVSDVDNILANRIKTKQNDEGFNMRDDVYIQTKELIQKVLITDFIKDKKVFIALNDSRIAEYDLKYNEQQSEFLNDIIQSVEFLKDKLLPASNPFLNALLPKKHRDGFIELNIPYLSDRSPADYTILQKALTNLDAVQDTNFQLQLAALKNALGIYSLIVTRGKRSKHSFLPLFEKLYTEYSASANKSPMLGDGGVIRYLLEKNKDEAVNLRNNNFVSLLIPDSLMKYNIQLYSTDSATDPESGEIFTIEDMIPEETNEEAMHSTSKYNREYDIYMNQIIKPGKFYKIFTINNEKLSNNVYVTATIGKYENIAIILRKKYNNVVLSANVERSTSDTFDTLTGIPNEFAQDIHNAGYSIGVEVDIDTEGGKGSVIAYLGNGKYLIADNSNSEGNVFEMIDSELSELNEEMLFLGNNVKKAYGNFINKSSQLKRNTGLAVIADILNVDGYDVMLVDNKIHAKKYKSKTKFISSMNDDVAEKFMSYALDQPSEFDINMTEADIVNATNAKSFLLLGHTEYNKIQNKFKAVNPLDPTKVLLYLKKEIDNNKGINVLGANVATTKKGWTNSAVEGRNLNTIALSYSLINGLKSAADQTKVANIIKGLMMKFDVEDVIDSDPRNKVLKKLNMYSSIYFNPAIKFTPKIMTKLNTLIDEKNNC